MHKSTDMTKKKRRRIYSVFVVAALILGAGASAAVFEWRASSSAPFPQNVTLVYVGANDCAPCREWQQVSEPEIRSLAEADRLHYRAVKSPTLFNILDDEYWPEDLRVHRDRLERGAGVPLWLVIADGEIVDRAFGKQQWLATVYPRIKSLLR